MRENGIWSSNLIFSEHVPGLPDAMKVGRVGMMPLGTKQLLTFS